MNEIPLTRVATVSRDQLSQYPITDKNRGRLNNFVNFRLISRQISTITKVLLVFVVLCISRVEATVSDSKEYSDKQMPPNVQIVDSSRISLSRNDSRIAYSGTGSIFSHRKSIDQANRKPDFCLRFALSENFNPIDSFTMCYKFTKFSEEFGRAFGFGISPSGYSNKKMLSSGTSFINRSGKSTEIENRFTITSKNYHQDIKVILIYDSTGVSTLSNISDSLNISVIKIDCKQNKRKCKPSYEF